MRIIGLVVFTMVLVQPAWVFAKVSSASSPRQGCRVIDVHCYCTNPAKDFVVQNQKLGRSNPGEPGECKTKVDVDASAKQMPIAYCLKGESVKDARKGESKCTANWTCKKPCTIK
jgi:hypothetical protein